MGETKGSAEDLKTLARRIKECGIQKEEGCWYFKEYRLKEKEWETLSKANLFDKPHKSGITKMDDFFAHTYPLETLPKLENGEDHPRSVKTVYKERIGGLQPDKLKVTYETIDFICGSRDLKSENNEPHWETTGLLSIPSKRMLEDCSKILMPGWKYASDHYMI